jgi:hypothetical protein
MKGRLSEPAMTMDFSKPTSTMTRYSDVRLEVMSTGDIGPEEQSDARPKDWYLLIYPDSCHLQMDDWKFPSGFQLAGTHTNL